jgi:hypothetical protein
MLNPRVSGTVGLTAILIGVVFTASAAIAQNSPFHNAPPSAKEMTNPDTGDPKAAPLGGRFIICAVLDAMGGVVRDQEIFRRLHGERFSQSRTGSFSGSSPREMCRTGCLRGRICRNSKDGTLSVT